VVQQLLNILMLALNLNNLGNNKKFSVNFKGSLNLLVQAGFACRCRLCSVDIDCTKPCAKNYLSTKF
jgi:hypothetical protein